MPKAVWIKPRQFFMHPAMKMPHLDMESESAGLPDGAGQWKSGFFPIRMGLGGMCPMIAALLCTFGFWMQG